MNLGIFDILVRWTELTGCSIDEALMFVAIIWFIFFALLAWAFGFAFDLGSVLYEGVKELFRFVRRQFRRKKKDEP